MSAHPADSDPALLENGGIMDEVLFSIEAGEGRIAINRPGKSNALNPDVLDQLRRAIRIAGEDPDVRVLTISGEGEKVFCAGLDLKAALLAENKGFGRLNFRQLLLDIVDCPKPTIALARGHVMGGGLGIVLACDLCIACDDIHFSTPEILVGMFPMMVLGLLYRNVGRKKATELMFLGERISAIQAQQIGIINRAIPRNRFQTESADLVRKLAGRSPTILAMGKKAIGRLLDRKFPQEEEFLESALVEVLNTEDSRKGIRTFLEKKPKP
jgi:enoyl-CoA hydratase